jgi:Signal transduction histidine kinase
MESTYGEAHGLKDALHKLAEELRLSSQVSAVVNVDESSEMVGAPIDMQLFRITQEAVHNAIAHGHAKNIEIALQASSDAIVLTIDDDGEGFDEGPPGNGMGMRTMQYRAQTIGGALTVNSRRGSGTTISCSVPKAHPHREVSARLSL